MKGLVLKSTGSWYEVLGDDDTVYACRTRGKLRLDGDRETNPVAVGDKVMFDVEGREGIIGEVMPRTNNILRQSVKKTGQSHVLAANVDQVLLLATLKHPRTSLGFIDRFLISAEAFRIPQILIFNKTDLLSETELQQQELLKALYQSVGVRCIATSLLNDDLSEIASMLKGKVTLMAGHSGVGKSTLINKLEPAANQAVGNISDFSNKGIHTTTFAEMFRLPGGIFIIDTPGVKEWGLADMEQQEISDYFPEMRELRLQCKFGSRCLHINEPKCAILDAVEKGIIARSRYESYLSMVSGSDNRK